MTTMLIIAGGLWVGVSSALGLALCMAAKRSMPAPTQEAMQPQRAPQAAVCNREDAFVANAAREHAGVSA
jgi:hypothetical protein